MKYLRHIFTCVLTTASLLTSASAVTITTQPISKIINQGQATSFSVAASGTGTLSYQWQKDGLDIPGAVVSVYAISNAKPWHIGDYTVKVTDSVGTVTSEVATLSLSRVNSGIWKGLVAYYPFSGNANDVSISNNNGVVESASLTEDKMGIANMAYQFNGSTSRIATQGEKNLPVGNSDFTLSVAVKVAQPISGDWRLLVANGSFDQFQFTLGDGSLNERKLYMHYGGVGYELSPQLQWQDGKWYHLIFVRSGNLVSASRDGIQVGTAAVAGGNNATPGSRSLYFGRRSDGAHPWMGALDQIRIYNRALSETEVQQLYNYESATGPEITTPPISRTAYASQAATFSVVAAGAGSITYQWRKNGIDIPLATSATLNLVSVNKLNEGTYDVVVTDDNDSVISEAAMLTVISPAIFTDPTSRSGYAGQSTTFNVIAAGTGTVTYQWRKSGVNIPTATSSSLTLSPLNYRSAAEYDVVVTDDFESATSESAELTVLSPAPNVSISPGDTTVALGGNLTFTATVDTGIPPFAYQWRKNSLLIAKATNPTLVLTNIQRTQEGIYDVVVKNASGVDVSNTARLSLPPLVAVTANPADTAVNPGQTASFTVDVPGATAWQWLKNGVAIKNATASTLGVLNVDASSAGLYSVTVTTPAGKVTTPAAQLRVNDSGLLIYKLTGTGTAYEGTVSTVAALSGYMILDRAGQRGGLILGSKRGSQSIHSLEVHENLHTQSTGPVPKTQTEVSEMVADEFVLWVNGADSLLTIQKTLSRTDLAVGPATLKGYANSIDIGTKVRIETVSLTLVLDAVNSIPARQNAETVEQVMSRISQDMQLKGSALME
jgi:hypothetical protein